MSDHPNLHATVEDGSDDDLDFAPKTQAPDSQLGVSADGETPAPTDAELEALSEANNDAQKPKKNAPLDIKSEEAFPSLMAPSGPSAAAGLWGAKGRPSAAAASAAKSLPKPSNGALSIPGQFVDRLELNTSQLIPQNKLPKPTTAILADVKKRTGAYVTIRPGSPGSVVFEAQGKKKAVQQALSDIVGIVGLKTTVKHSVPASVRPFIIGKQGSTIQEITERTKARIRLPRPGEHDDEDEVEISIEGNPLSIMLAKKEIDDIVDERTSTLTFKLRNVPAEYYPFIDQISQNRFHDLQNSGNIQVTVPQYYTWIDQPPARVEFPGQSAAFCGRSREPIVVTGDRSVAQEARRRIEQCVAHLKASLTCKELSVERGRHQFIMGSKGVSIDDFLNWTGCTVVLPPAHSDEELLSIIGPPNRLEGAIEKIHDLATRMMMSTVDVGRLHGNNRSHGFRLTDYFKHRKAIEKLEKDHLASIVIPTNPDGPCAWEVYALDGKDLYKARSGIINLINSHPPARMGRVQANPFFHNYLREKVANDLRSKYGVHLVFPNNTAAEEVMIVAEARCPEDEYVCQADTPTGADIAAYQKDIDDAVAHLQSLIGQYPTIASRCLDVEDKFYARLAKFVEQSHIDQLFPPQIYRERANASSLSIRGAQPMIEKIIPEIAEFIEQERRDEVERTYTTSFEFSQKYANLLIGKGGENIRKLRAEFDVEINVRDGKVELQGPQAKAYRCKAHILSLERKWADEAILVLKIDPQFHRELIGAQGSQVNKLQTRYNVHINFPRTIDNDDGGEGLSGKKADEVTIRGPSSGAREARSELQDLLKYIVEHSNSADVVVARDLLPSIIGQSGRELDNLRIATGAKIDIPGREEGGEGRVAIHIRGTREQVSSAKAVLEERSARFDATITKSVDVDSKYHRMLIGAEGANIKRIILEAGGPEDSRERSRMVQFPSASSGKNTVVVSGPSSVVEGILASIRQQVSLLQNRVTETHQVPQNEQGKLIGRSGVTKKEIERKFNVTIEIPRRGTPDPEGGQVKISGQADNVKECKVHIDSLVQPARGVTIDVPFEKHYQISDGGRFFSGLRRQHNVAVDVGRNVPSRGEPPAMDVSEVTWREVDAAEGDARTVVWTLKGSDEAIKAAKKAIEDELASCAVSGYLYLPDTSVYSHIVGPRGRVVSTIRQETGAKIAIPREGGPIELVGTAEGVEAAKAAILQIVFGE